MAILISATSLNLHYRILNHLALVVQLVVFMKFCIFANRSPTTHQAMSKKELTTVIMLLVAGTSATLQAQELPLWLRLKVERSMKGPMLLKPSELHFDPNSPFAWEDKAAQEKYELQMERYNRAQKSIEPIKQKSEMPAVKFTFRIRGGNAGGNWSPFPDRALDARTIRYPMPQPNFDAPPRGPKAAPRR